MTTKRHDPRGAALALPLDERAELAAELLASLQAVDEAMKRIAAIPEASTPVPGVAPPNSGLGECS